MGLSVGTAYQAAGTTAKEDADGNVIEVTEKWFVRTAFNATVQTALAASGLPAVNAAHGTYTKLRVAERVPLMDPSGIKWLFDVVYKPVSTSSQTDFYRLVLIEYGTHEIQMDVTHNFFNGQPILDANNRPFQQTYQVAREFPYIKLTKKQKTVNRKDVLTISGTINDDVVTVAGVKVEKHCGKIRIRAVENDSKDYPWEISYEILVRYHTVRNFIDFGGKLQEAPKGIDIGWDEAYLNQGFYVYKAGVGVVRAIEKVVLSDNSTEERPSGTPVLLDKDGVELAAGATPISMRIQVFPEEDWSKLGLNKL